MGCGKMAISLWSVVRHIVPVEINLVGGWMRRDKSAHLEIYLATWDRSTLFSFSRPLTYTTPFMPCIQRTCYKEVLMGCRKHLLFIQLGTFIGNKRPSVLGGSSHGESPLFFLVVMPLQAWSVQVQSKGSLLQQTDCINRLVWLWTSRTNARTPGSL